MENEMSNFDAFLALKDLDEEEIVIPASRHSRLKEGKSFDVRDDRAMEVAKKFTEEKEATDLPLEVYSTDPLTDNDIVNHKDVIGLRLCKCGKCHATRVIDINNLQDNGDGTYSVKEGDNTCPLCHDSDTTYTITGMVGVAPENKPEPTLDNDQEKPEVGFDNDEMTNSETEGEPVVPTEGPAEPAPEETPAAEAKPEETSDSEGAWDETDAEDDTADMKDTTGDEFDADDVKADDTEEPFPWEDDLEPSEKEKVDNDILFDEPEDKKEKKEALNEEIAEGSCVHDLFDMIIEPSNIREINVFDLNGNSIYSGEYPDGKEYMFHWVDAELASWDVAEGRLILNVTAEQESDETLSEALELLDGMTDKIDLFDLDEEEEIFSGNYDEVLEQYGDYYLGSIDAPDVLNICIAEEIEDAEDYTPSLATDDLAAGQWYESLTKKICEANGLRYYRAEKEGSQEYWIRESIKAKEDLGVVYENFLSRIADKDLINEFKELTGYRTVLDEMLADELSEGGSFKSEIAGAQKKAREQSVRDDCDVVYGYMTSGQFYELPDMYSVRDNRELNMAAELVRAKYHPTGIVYVWYKRNNADLEEGKKLSGEETLLHNIVTDDYIDPATGEHDPEMDKNLKSFKTRKELAAAIQECKNNNTPYKVTKSLTEGYRYDLLIEEVDEDKEYRQGAENFVKEIKTMSLGEVEECMLDYNFEKNPPEDDVEEMIWNALKERKAELMKPASVEESLTEDAGKFVNEFGIPTIDPELERMPEDLEDEELPEIDTTDTWTVFDIDENTGDETSFLFNSEEEANAKFDALKKEYEGNNLHTVVLNKSGDLVRKWNAEEGIKDEFKDPSLTEELPIVPVEAEPEVEVIDAPVPDENAGADIVPEGMRPEDVEIVQKLMRISGDTARAIHEYYGVEADPRLILADMIQDLRLIGGAVRPEELANTPINELTKEMYAQYNGFTDMIEDMFLGHRTSAAQRLERAIGMLDSEEFSTPAIEQKIASDKFLTYAQRGAIPFIAPEQIRRIGHEE